MYKELIRKLFKRTSRIWATGYGFFKPEIDGAWYEEVGQLEKGEKLKWKVKIEKLKTKNWKEFGEGLS